MKTIIAVDSTCDLSPELIKENNIKGFLNNGNYTLLRVDIRNKEEIQKIFNNRFCFPKEADTLRR